MGGQVELIRSLYRYNSRVRQRYLNAIWRLPARERYRDRGASYPSLVDIYLHVLDAYRWWFLCVIGRQSSVDWYPLGQRYSLAEAKAQTRAVDREVGRVLREVRERDLERKLSLPRPRRETVSLRVILLHMAEEELQHRGEMNALLWQAGHDAPVVGFDD
jgi:uncharacterized damage-inducible protein DinB